MNRITSLLSLLLLINFNSLWAQTTQGKTSKEGSLIPLTALNTFTSPTPGGEESSITFMNELDRVVNICWVHYDGEIYVYDHLEPNKKLYLPCPIGQIWLITDREKPDKYLAAFRVAERDGLALINNSAPKPKQKRNKHPEPYTPHKQPTVYQNNLNVHWYDNHNKFWYERKLPNNEHEFVSVDALTGKKELAFDHETVATLIGDSTDPKRLPFTAINITANGIIHLIANQGKTLAYNPNKGTISPISIDQKMSSLKPEKRVSASGYLFDPTTMTFVNQLKHPISLHWVDQEEFLNLNTPFYIWDYASNNFGIYNIMGNVSEMTNEKGIAKGGSFRDAYSDCEVNKDFKYSSPREDLGFRCLCKLKWPNKE